jgi:hypothetical protein
MGLLVWEVYALDFDADEDHCTLVPRNHEWAAVRQNIERMTLKGTAMKEHGQTNV